MMLSCAFSSIPHQTGLSKAHLKLSSFECLTLHDPNHQCLLPGWLHLPPWSPYLYSGLLKASSEAVVGMNETFTAWVSSGHSLRPSSHRGSCNTLQDHLLLPAPCSFHIIFVMFWCSQLTSCFLSPYPFGVLVRVRVAALSPSCTSDLLMRLFFHYLLWLVLMSTCPKIIIISVGRVLPWRTVWSFWLIWKERLHPDCGDHLLIPIRIQKVC